MKLFYTCLALLLVTWTVEGSHVHHFTTSNILTRLPRSVEDMEWTWRPNEWFSDQDEAHCSQDAGESREQHDCEEETSEISDLNQKISALNNMVQLEIKLKEALQTKISNLEEKVLNLKLENLLAKNNAKPDTKLTEENNELKLKVKNLQTKIFSIELEHNACTGKLNVLEQSLSQERQKCQSLTGEVGTLRSGTAALEQRLRSCDEARGHKDVAMDELRRHYEGELESCRKRCVVDKDMTDKIRNIFRG